MDGRTDGQMHGRMDRWKGGRTDGWMDGLNEPYIKELVLWPQGQSSGNEAIQLADLDGVPCRRPGFILNF